MISEREGGLAEISGIGSPALLAGGAKAIALAGCHLSPPRIELFVCSTLYIDDPSLIGHGSIPVCTKLCTTLYYVVRTWNLNIKMSYLNFSSQNNLNFKLVFLSDTKGKQEFGQVCTATSTASVTSSSSFAE